MAKIQKAKIGEEFPVSLSTFAKTLKFTKEEVWVGVLKTRHLHAKLTISGWKALIESLKSEPIIPGR